MSDSPVIDNSIVRYFDATFAAQYLNSKLVDLGEYSQKYTCAKVLDQAEKGKIQFKPAENGEDYEFELAWLSEYLKQQYAMQEPSITTLLSDIPDPRENQLQPSIVQTDRQQPQFSLKKYIESHALIFICSVVVGSFITGVASVTTIFPEIRSRLAIDHVNVSNPNSPESIANLKKVLSASAADSVLAAEINDMATSGVGIFENLNYSNNVQLLESIKQIQSDDPNEIEPFRALVKNHEGPFLRIDREVNLKLIYPEDVENNALLKQVKDSLAATCSDAFEYKSAINITARAINAREQTPLLGLKTVYANIAYPYDECPDNYEEPTTVWVDAAYVGQLFSGGSASVDTIVNVDVKVELNASFQLPDPNILE